jgi:membrane protein
MKFTDHFIKLFEKTFHKLLLLFRFLVMKAKRIELPIYDGLNLYDIISFFFKGIYEGAITMRAGSVSFSLFLALFPGIIFIFTLIPYVPIDGFQQQIFQTLSEVLPSSSYEAAKETINDIILTKRGNLLSLTFIMTLIFATNGTLALLSGFSYSISLVTVGEIFLTWLSSHHILEGISLSLVIIGRMIVLIFTILLSISLLYNYGTVKGGHWKFFSVGSVLATILVVLSSLAFGYYVDNFSQYNKLYGSIGTLMVIMLWIYVNAIGLIIGFELNASIAGAKFHRAKNKPQRAQS